MLSTVISQAGILTPQQASMMLVETIGQITP
jgi:deferrochelatase/peroxidase EfeB